MARTAHSPIGTTKVLGYVRVSTEEQAERGVSLDAQRAKLEAYATLYDLELVEVIVDAGVSAKSFDRPGLQHALSLLRKGKTQALLVAKLDRLTRSMRDLGTLVEEELVKGKWALLSVAEQLDTRTAPGRLVLNIATTRLILTNADSKGMLAAGGVVKSSPAAANPLPQSRGAVHSAEIEYALGNLSSNKVYAWTPDDYKVSKLTQEYFANFIKKGAPNGPGLPTWPAANSSNGGGGSGGGGDTVQVMRLDVESHAEPDKNRARYLFLDQLPTKR